MLTLWPLLADGTVRDLPFPVPDVATPALETFKNLYQTTPYQPPWIGYLVSEDDHLVGTCAFKGPPVEGLVEIAYFTFPGYEGRGVATRMAQRLIDLSLAEDPRVTVIAQTLPAFSASTSLLKKLGFVMRRSLVHPEDGLVWEWHRDHGQLNSEPQ